MKVLNLQVISKQISFIYIEADADNNAIYRVNESERLGNTGYRIQITLVGEPHGVITSPAELYWIDGTTRVDNSDILVSELTWHHASANTYIDLDSEGDTASTQFIIPEGALLKQDNNYFHRVSNISIVVEAGDDIPTLLNDSDYLLAGSSGTIHASADFVNAPFNTNGSPIDRYLEITVDGATSSVDWSYSWTGSSFYRCISI